MFERIREWLDENDVAYRHVHHAPTPTSEDSARERGESIDVGGKALLVKAGEQFRLVVLSAALRLDSKSLRRELGERQIRFATRDELLELTGLVPGSVPPFGEPILPFPLHVDESTLANDRIAFNAGSLTDSLILSIEDYRRVTTIESVVRVGRPA